MFPNATGYPRYITVILSPLKVNDAALPIVFE
jgi:hypothetical protein